MHTVTTNAVKSTISVLSCELCHTTVRASTAKAISHTNTAIALNTTRFKNLPISDHPFKFLFRRTYQMHLVGVAVRYGTRKPIHAGGTPPTVSRCQRAASSVVLCIHT